MSIAGMSMSYTRRHNLGTVRESSIKSGNLSVSVKNFHLDDVKPMSKWDRYFLEMMVGEINVHRVHFF